MSHTSNRLFCFFSRAFRSIIFSSRCFDWVRKLVGLVVFPFLVLLCVSAVQAQTQVTNTAAISPPVSVTNTNSAPSCLAGVCTAADMDTVSPSHPTVSKFFPPLPSASVERLYLPFQFLITMRWHLLLWRRHLQIFIRLAWLMHCHHLSLLLVVLLVLLLLLPIRAL